ncbi:MAG TPA: hypothetical protein PLN41_11820 [Methanothrix sp.]|jgi:hypothetical protein|nr:hypothetical protein [Methanothrix sp.]
MICNKISRPLMAMAIVSILAAAGPISVSMAAEEGGANLSNLNSVEEGPVAGAEIMTNATLNKTTNITNITDSVNLTNQSMAVDVDEAAIGVTLLGNGSEEEGAEVEALGVGAGAQEPTDLRSLGGGLVASAAGNATDLSTLDLDMTPASTTNATEPVEAATLGGGLNASAERTTDLSTVGPGSAAASTSNATEPMDVKVLGNVLVTPPAEKVRALSTLGNVTVAATNATEATLASLSNVSAERGEATTDVKALKEALGIEL